MTNVTRKDLGVISLLSIVALCVVGSFLAFHQSNNRTDGTKASYTRAAPVVPMPAQISFGTKEILQDLHDACCPGSEASCCDKISCWDSKKGKISSVCSSLFVEQTRKGIGDRGHAGSPAKSSAFKAVLDFECQHMNAAGNVVKSFECFVASLALLTPALQDKFESIAIISPTSMIPFMDPLCHLIVREGIKVTFFIGNEGPLEDISQLTCFAAHRSPSSISMENGYNSWYVYNGAQGTQGTTLSVTKKKLVAAAVREAYGRPESCERPCDKIVVLLGDGKKRLRGFIDEADLLAALRDHFGPHHIATLNDTESMLGGADLMSSACAVLGYHGAGFPHMLHACPGTLHLEVTTFKTVLQGKRVSSNGWDPLRRGGESTDSLDVIWEPKFVEFHHVWPNKVHTDDGYRTLQEANVLLSREHIDDIIRRLDRFLARPRHEPHAVSAGGANPAAGARRDVTHTYRLPPVHLAHGKDVN